jgi:hypothetical protein
LPAIALTNSPPLHMIAVNTQIDRSWRTAFSPGKSKKASDFSTSELSIGEAGLQQAVGKSHNQEIISFFQLVVD